MGQAFDDILDECVTAILREGATVADCLGQFPQESTELNGLLSTAARLAQLSAVKPSPAAKAAALRRLQTALEVIAPAFPDGQSAESLAKDRSSVNSERRARPSRPVTGKPKRHEVLTRSEVAELFGVSPNTISRWARDGLLPSTLTLGGQRRYPKALIAKLLEEHAPLPSSLKPDAAMFGEETARRCAGGKLGGGISAGGATAGYKNP